MMMIKKTVLSALLAFGVLFTPFSTASAHAPTCFPYDEAIQALESNGFEKIWSRLGDDKDGRGQSVTHEFWMDKLNSKWVLTQSGYMTDGSRLFCMDFSGTDNDV